MILILQPRAVIINTRMYTVREAAGKIGVSERYLRLLLSTGKIEGRKLGRDWIVLKLDYKRKRRIKGDKL
jgi:excisionase family DNA binding protein